MKKADWVAKEVARAVNAGKQWDLETVDFSDPARPLTCLEVDFPIIPINQIATIEASSGAATKPIYQMSKWWARRQASVFRSLLLAAAIKAPDDPSEAAKLVWDVYYGNHQAKGVFKNLKVADIFMGGGTTVVEGSRLGMQMYGNDLNPVAWFVVKNEVAQVDKTEVQALAPGVPLVVTDTDCPHAAAQIDQWGKIQSAICPLCGEVDVIDRLPKSMAKPGKKKIGLSLLVHPDWLKGEPGNDSQGQPYGGSADDDVEATVRWNQVRAASCKLVEVRGALPDEITCPETGVVIKTGNDGGTVPGKSTFTCQAETCGRDHNVLDAVSRSKTTGDANSDFLGQTTTPGTARCPRPAGPPRAPQRGRSARSRPTGNPTR
jgi:hypothetical protein